MSNSTLLVLNLTFPSTAAYVYSSIYLFVSTFCLVSYLFFLLILIIDKENFNGTVYRIIFHLGISDCIQLLLQWSPFFFTIFNVPIDAWINKICGAILDGAWYSFISLTLLLALDRFITLCLSPYFSKVFDEKLLNIFIAITWIWGVMILGLTLSPLVSQLYDINTSSWSYSPDKPINWPPIELAIAVSQVSLGGVFYLLIMLKLIIHKKSNHIDTSYKNEIRLLIVAIIITIYVALGNAYWNFLYNYVNDPHLAGFIGNMILIIQNGMNPFLYLTMSNFGFESILQNSVERVNKFAAKLILNDLSATYASLLERLQWKPISRTAMESRIILMDHYVKGRRIATGQRHLYLLSNGHQRKSARICHALEHAQYADNSARSSSGKLPQYDSGRFGTRYRQTS